MNIGIIIDIGIYFVPIKLYKYYRFISLDYNCRTVYLKNRIIKKYERETKIINKQIFNILNQNKNLYINSYISALRCYLNKKLYYRINIIKNLCNIHDPIISFITHTNIKKLKIYKVRIIHNKDCFCEYKHYGCRSKSNNFLCVKKEEIMSTVDFEKDKMLFSKTRYNFTDMLEVRSIYPFFYFLKRMEYRIETEPPNLEIFSKTVSMDGDSVLNYISNLDFKFVTYQNSKMIIKKWR